MNRPDRFLSRQRALVLDRIAAAGGRGLTDDEGERALGLRSQSYTPRRGELVRAGLVRATRHRRLTELGRWATVWVAARHAGRARC